MLASCRKQVSFGPNEFSMFCWMRLARLADNGTAVAFAESLLDIAASLPAYHSADAAGADKLSRALGEASSGSWEPLIERWDEFEGYLGAMAESAEAGRGGFVVRDLNSVELRAPLPSPNVRLFALGGNFAKHLADASRVAYGDTAGEEETLRRRRAQGPWGFIVLPDTIVGTEATIAPPRGIEKLDYEAEVAVVLQRGGRDVGADDVRIWGYTAFNDFSLRDALFDLGEPYDKGPFVWPLHKNFDTGSSCGPWMVVGEPFDVDSLHITLRVNGETRQVGSTREMIFTFAETAVHLSRFLTLKPGDMIASGTPAGTALEAGIDGPFLAEGDVVECEVEGVGLLRNRVGVAAPRRVTDAER